MYPQSELALLGHWDLLCKGLFCTIWAISAIPWQEKGTLCTSWNCFCSGSSPKQQSAYTCSSTPTHYPDSEPICLSSCSLILHA